jgi:histidinol-phosphate aminotransferase
MVTGSSMTRGLLAQPHYVSMPPPQSDLRSAMTCGSGQVVYLANNECPYPPFEAVQKVIAEVARDVHHYPANDCSALTQAIAANHDLSPEHVLVGAGVADVISFACRTVAGPGDQVVYAWPGFEMYPLAGTFAGAVNVPVPLGPSLRQNLQRMLELARSPSTKVVALSNPHNPTGTHIPQHDLLSFLDQVPEHVLVLNDEAYFEYADAEDYPRLPLALLDRPNVLTTRTFSKAHGLAGLRVGYGLGAPALVATLSRGRNPFAVSHIAQAAAVEALRHPHEVASRVVANRAARAALGRALAERGFDVPSSQANFLFAVPPDGRDWHRLLLDRGIVVRAFAGALRISVGPPADIAAFLSAMDEISAPTP